MTWVLVACEPSSLICLFYFSSALQLPTCLKWACVCHHLTVCSSRTKQVQVEQCHSGWSGIFISNFKLKKKTKNKKLEGKGFAICYIFSSQSAWFFSRSLNGFTWSFTCQGWDHEGFWNGPCACSMTRSPINQETSTVHRFTCRLRAWWQDLVLLRVDDSGAPHQRRDEGGDDGGVHPRDGNVCGKRRLLDSLALHRQPEVVHEHLVRDRNLGPGELQGTAERLPTPMAPLWSKS